MGTGIIECVEGNCRPVEEAGPGKPSCQIFATCDIQKINGRKKDALTGIKKYEREIADLKAKQTHLEAQVARYKQKDIPLDDEPKVEASPDGGTKPPRNLHPPEKKETAKEKKARLKAEKKAKAEAKKAEKK